MTILCAQNSNHKRAARSINWQSLNSFTEIPELAPLKHLEFLIVRFVKSFAQLLSKGTSAWGFIVQINSKFKLTRPGQTKSPIFV